MSFAIAAAGTGGHVYPGLAVGEALVGLGVARDEVLYIGGNRMEAKVYPAGGFPFLSVELRGLQRRLTGANLGIPSVVLKATRTISAELKAREVGALLGMGGYVTVPAGWAARRAGIRYAVSEQNAHAGLANRVMARSAARVFGSFPVTTGLPTASWVGNPVRASLAAFERGALRPRAIERWRLDPGLPVLGVFGGSLGAGAINAAVATAVENWAGPEIQVLHLAGQGYAEMNERAAMSPRRWTVLEFCEEMELFYAATDLVIARAGGSVAELTATATPSILVPGVFGSGGHQAANAAFLADAGAAVVLTEEELGDLGAVSVSLMADPERRGRMSEACAAFARPDAARVVAEAMMEMAS